MPSDAGSPDLLVVGGGIIGLAVAWRGWEGRWTLWMNVIPYGAFMAVALRGGTDS